MSPVMPWSKAGQREPVEAGSYLVKVLGFEARKAISSGNPTINWEMKIVGGEGNPNIGRNIWDTHTLIEKAMWRLGWFVNALGIETKTLPDMNTGTESFNKVLRLCVGRTMWVTVIVDSSYDPKKPRNKVTDYMPDPEQAKMENVDVDDIPDFVKNKGENPDGIPF